MKLLRIVLKVCLVGYLLQIATAIYFAAVPVAVRALPGTTLTASLKKDVDVLCYVPLLGFAFLAWPQNYHVVLSNGYEEKRLGIDMKADLPIEDLQAISAGKEAVVVRQSTGREIARLPYGP